MEKDTSGRADGISFNNNPDEGAFVKKPVTITIGEEAGDQLHQLVQRLDECRGEEIRPWLESGEIFYKINLSKHWEDLGYASFKAFCAAHQYGHSTARKRMKVHDTFIVGELVSGPEALYPVGTESLYKIADHVTDENVTDFLAQAETLSLTDLGLWMVEEGYDTPTAESHESCVMIVWFKYGSDGEPVVTCHEHPGVAKDELKEYCEYVSQMGRAIDDICADVYHLSKGFPQNYAYRKGVWKDANDE